MSRFSDKLLYSYAAHYQRGNAYGVDPRAVPDRLRRMNEATFGRFIDRRLAPGAAVLDLGCGTGLLLGWLSSRPGLRLFGVDASESQVAIAKTCLPHVSVECNDGLRYLEAREGSFDAIFCLDVLEHLDSDVLLDWVEAARRALRPAGFLLCRGPNAANLTAPYARYMDLTHHRCFTYGSFVQLLETGGFKNVESVPVRAGHPGGAARQFVESAVHRAIFRLCGRALERVFTSTIVVVGVRGDE